MTPIISLDHVWYSYDGSPVLEDVTLDVFDHDFLGIIGPNGGGKTTLLKVMLGLLAPQKGRVTVRGGSPAEHRTAIGYVPQYRTFDFGYPVRVLDVVLMGRLGHIPGPFRKYSQKDRNIAMEALEAMGIADLAGRQVDLMSGGQQQKVILARALATEPEVLLLDEPTNHVDVRTEEHFFGILKDLHKRMAIVVVSHDIGAISTHVDRIACLNRRLYVHDSGEITGSMLAEAYQCPIELIAHGVPHRVLAEHGEDTGP
ncbi:MAG: ABC transporter ATP-binding protein [Methanomicrobiales archaeon]|nr:ABC transporter ATP-binding protein [Methanomicrobiales archaeon]